MCSRATLCACFELGVVRVFLCFCFYFAFSLSLSFLLFSFAVDATAWLVLPPHLTGYITSFFLLLSHPPLSCFFPPFYLSIAGHHPDRPVGPVTSFPIPWSPLPHRTLGNRTRIQTSS